MSEQPMALNTALYLWPDNFQIKEQSPFFPCAARRWKTTAPLLEQAVQILSPSGPSSEATAWGPELKSQKSLILKKLAFLESWPHNPYRKLFLAIVDFEHVQIYFQPVSWKTMIQPMVFQVHMPIMMPPSNDRMKNKKCKYKNWANCDSQPLSCKYFHRTFLFMLLHVNSPKTHCGLGDFLIHVTVKAPPFDY